MPLFSTFGAASLKGFNSGAAPLLMDALIIAGGGGGNNGSPLGTANGGGGAGGYRRLRSLRSPWKYIHRDRWSRGVLEANGINIFFLWL